jgi:hypothetical protein
MAQEMTLWQPSTALSPKKRYELAVVKVRYSTSRRQALEQARKLIGCYPHSRPPDVDAYANALADVLEQYPFGVVEECCNPRTGIVRRREFPPTIACIVQWCDLYTGAAMNLARLGPPKPEQTFSDEHCRSMRQRLQALMHNLLGAQSAREAR